MLVMGIESATPVASVALLDETGLLGETLLNVGLTHSEQLLPMIDDLLRQCRRNIRELTAIGISAGPGSFTGLRIGMATAKALVQGLRASAGAEDDVGAGALASAGASTGASAQGENQKRLPQLIAIPTTEAMAWQTAGLPGLVSPMLNARREQVYTALYRWRVEDNAAEDSGNVDSPSFSEIFAARQRGKKDRILTGAGGIRYKLECLIPPLAIAAEDWAIRLQEYGESIYLVGEGVYMYQEIWQYRLSGKALPLPPIAGICRGSYIALAAMDRLGEAEDFYGMKPIYLRGI